jgi:hypothetical protein
MSDQESLLLYDLLPDLAADDIGVWEVGWRANVLLVDTPASTRNEIAEAVVERLILERLAVFVDEDGLPSGHPMAAPEFERRGRLRATWANGEADTTLWLRATAATLEWASSRQIPPPADSPAV